MANNIRNIFVSHIHEDDDGLRKLKDLLKSNGMTPRDYSINKDNPNRAHNEDYIKSQIIAPRILKSSTLVVYISPDTKGSPWVDWEIEYAQKNDKRIIGVWAHGESQCDVPDALKKYADAVVGWQGNRVIDAIEGRISDWEDPNGTKQPPHTTIPRVTCR